MLLFLILLSCYISTTDTADTGRCDEIVVDCPYRAWTPDDYAGSNANLDPYACFAVGAGQEVTATQEGCADRNPDHECDGRPAEVEERVGEDGSSLVCFACSYPTGEVYYGHPDYTGECAVGDVGCVEQPIPPWNLLRVLMCDG